MKGICLFIQLSLIYSSHAKQPNVLLIVVDDLKPVFGVYGSTSAYTPNIDKFSQRSFVFKNAYAQQALCAPSRNSFLTSRRPDSLHLYDFYSYWRDVVGNFTTLPQHFKENDYYTHSIGKVFHPGISSNYSDDAKYSWSGHPYHPTTEIYKNYKVCVGDDGKLAKNLVCPVVVEVQPGGTLPDLESLNEAIRFLNNQRNITQNLPYFLAVGFHKPHIPLKFPVEYLKFHPLDKISLPTNRWRPSTLPVVAWNPWTDVRGRDDIAQINISFPFGQMPDFMTRRIIQSYNAATSYIDELIGQLLQNVGNNTIVVLTSDHGWSLGEHGEFAKYSNFAEATRIPLIIHVPGLSTREIIVDNLVELVDLFPTLVDLTQVSRSLDTCKENKSNWKLCTEGRSIVPVMVSSANQQNYSGKKAIFTQYPRPGIFPTWKPNSDEPKLKDISIMGYTIRTDMFTYTEWVHFNHSTCAPDWNMVIDKELYNRVIDDEENINLADRTELKEVIRNLEIDLRLGWRHFNKLEFI